MADYELLVTFRNIESELLIEGYKVAPVKSAFFVMREGRIVGDCQSVDGLRGFLQGIRWAKEEQNAENT